MYQGSQNLCIPCRNLDLTIYVTTYLETRNNLLWDGTFETVLSHFSKPWFPHIYCFLKYYWFDRPRPFHFSIVDEVDSVLIDEGRNPLLISGEVWSLLLSWTWFLQYCLSFLTISGFHLFTRIIEMQLGIQLLLKSQNFLWRVLWVFSYCYLTVLNISSLKWLFMLTYSCSITLLN